MSPQGTKRRIRSSSAADAWVERVLPRWRARTVVVIATLALTVLGCGSVATTGRAPFDGAALPSGVLAPDFTLTAQDGRAVSLGQQHGHVVVLAFLGSDCRGCALVAQQIRGALDELGGAAGVRSLLVEYARTPAPRARRAAFLAATVLSGRAAYLTGSRAELRRVWRAYRLPVSPSEAAITVILVDPHGYERVAFGLEQLTPEALSHDIRLLRDGRTAPAG